MLIEKLANAPGSTLNAFDGLFTAPLVAVTCTSDALCVIVTLSVRVPELKTPLVEGLNVPVSSVKPTVPVKLVTVLLFASCAVITTLKAVPATWGLLTVAKLK